MWQYIVVIATFLVLNFHLCVRLRLQIGLSYLTTNNRLTSQAELTSKNFYTLRVNMMSCKSLIFTCVYYYYFVRRMSVLSSSLSYSLQFTTSLVLLHCAVTVSYTHLTLPTNREV